MFSVVHIGTFQSDTEPLRPKSRGHTCVGSVHLHACGSHTVLPLFLSAPVMAGRAVDSCPLADFVYSTCSKFLLSERPVSHQTEI